MRMFLDYLKDFPYISWNSHRTSPLILRGTKRTASFLLIAHEISIIPLDLIVDGLCYAMKPRPSHYQIHQASSYS